MYFVFIPFFKYETGKNEIAEKYAVYIQLFIKSCEA